MNTMQIDRGILRRRDLRSRYNLSDEMIAKMERNGVLKRRHAYPGARAHYLPHEVETAIGANRP